MSVGTQTVNGYSGQMAQVINRGKHVSMMKLTWWIEKYVEDGPIGGHSPFGSWAKKSGIGALRLLLYTKPPDFEPTPQGGVAYVVLAGRRVRLELTSTPSRGTGELGIWLKIKLCPDSNIS